MVMCKLNLKIYKPSCLYRNVQSIKVFNALEFIAISPVLFFNVEASSYDNKKCVLCSIRWCHVCYQGECMLRVIETARQHPEKIGKIYAGLNGIIGALQEELIDTSFESHETIAALRYTPSGAFGSCRYKLKSLER
jgi:hypothetical protein